MSIETYRSWLHQQINSSYATLTKAESDLKELQVAVLTAHKEYLCYSKALEGLTFEVLIEGLIPEEASRKSEVASRKLENKENWEADASTPDLLATCDLRLATSDRTPAQMMSENYKQFSMVKAIQKYLECCDENGATFDEIEMEIFALDDADTETERKKLKVNLTSVLSSGVAKKKFQKVGRGIWAAYPESSRQNSDEEAAEAEEDNEEELETNEIHSSELVAA